MSNLVLQKLQHPATIADLAFLWAEPHRTQFCEATNFWLHTDDLGEILTINRKIGIECTQQIGVTGWFPVGHGSAILRWHGVISNYRGQGYSKEALTLLYKRLYAYNQRTLYELTNGDELKDYFLKLGFTEVHDPIVNHCMREAGGDFQHVLRLDLTAALAGIV